jgi:HSP20 family protein
MRQHVVGYLWTQNGVGKMKLPSLWSRDQDLISDPFTAMRRQMESMFRAFDRSWPSLEVGAGGPAISVAETKDAIEVTAELPGVDEKDIKVSLDGNRLVISGEKKADAKTEEKDWHVEERSYGAFYRAMSLPFEPADGAVQAHFDKGVLHLAINKPSEVAKTTRTIDIKPGAPEKIASSS